MNARTWLTGQNWFDQLCRNSSGFPDDGGEETINYAFIWRHSPEGDDVWQIRDLKLRDSYVLGSYELTE